MLSGRMGDKIRQLAKNLISTHVDEQRNVYGNYELQYPVK